LKILTAIRLSRSSLLGIEESHAKPHRSYRKKRRMNDFDPNSQEISRFALRELRRDELYLAAQLLGRGMCDNPMNVMTFGIAHRERRSRAMARFFLPVLQGLLARGLIMGAFDNACLVGVCVAACPRRCEPKTIEKLRPCFLLSCLVTPSLRHCEC
jgi:hypothetical protein